jgi:predicted dehydrogenase
VRRAREARVFLMEAMWTSFQPAARAIRELVSSGELGRPVVVDADLSGDFDVESAWSCVRGWW